MDVKHHEREETAVAGLRAQERLRAREVELGCHGWLDCLAVVSEECIKSPGEIKRREVELGSHSWMD